MKRVVLHRLDGITQIVGMVEPTDYPRALEDGLGLRANLTRVEPNYVVYTQVDPRAAALLNHVAHVEVGVEMLAHYPAKVGVIHA